MKEGKYIAGAFFASVLAALVHGTGAIFILNILASVVLIRVAFYAREIMGGEQNV